MKRKIIAALFFGLFSLKSFSAETFDLTPYWSISKGAMKSRGNLCGGWYDLTGNYICPNGLSLNNGQSVVATHDVNIHVYGGVELKGNNEIGDPVNSINIFSKNSDVKGQNDIEIFGHVESFGAVDLKNDIEIHGLISVSHGKVYLEDAHIKGSVTSESDTVEIKGNTNLIEGDIWGAKDIVLSKVTVKGGVTSSAGQIKTEVNSNIIEGDVVAHGDVVLKHTVVRGDVTSKGGAVKTENLNNQVYGDIEALHEVVLKGTKVVGDIQSLGEEIKLEEAGGGNSVYGNLIALHQVEIKKSLVCGQVTSRGSEVKLENSKENKNRGIYAYTNAIQASHKATVKNSSVCGSVVGHSYDFDNEKIYCGVNDPSCTPSDTDGTCPIDVIQSACPDMTPEPTQCKLLPMEDFNANDISNWSVIGFGQSIKPKPSSGRFVLNSSQRNQATASAYNYLFPSKDNYLEVEFDHYAHSGSGADGVALVLSDANVPPQTGAFGGPLGYGVKPNIHGFAGGWLGFGIDEYGNYSREGSFDDSPNRPSRPNAVAIRGSGIKNNSGHWMGGYRYIKGNNNVGDLDNRTNLKHRYKVIIDSREQDKVYITIQRKIGSANSWTTLISKFDVMSGFGQTTPPENFRVSITASTGDVTNIHEMDNFQVCADKYQKITEGIHHFEFDYAGTGSICQASEVTLRACMDASCSKTYPSSVLSSNPGATVDPVTVSLLPQSDSLVAWEGGDRVTFSDSVSLKLQAFQSGSAKLGIASSSVPQFGFDGAKCRIAGGPLSEQNCHIVFNSAALGVTVPDKVAGKPFFNTKGQAQYSNQSSPYLEFCSSPSQQDGDGENRDVQLSIERIEPTSNAVSVPVYVSFKKRDGKFSDEVSVGTTDVDIADVYFNSQGKAYFNLRYPEAGKVALKAKIKDESDSLGQNSFVSFPAYLTLSTDGGQCSSGSCSQGFVAAGEPFNMFVTAHQFGGALAKNYQQEGLSVVHKVTYPTTGALSAGVLGKDVYNHDTPTNAKDSIEQSVSEVGAFEFTVTPPEAYLGSKAFVIEPAKGVIGRFYPKYFKVYPDESADWDYPNAQSFAYMNQPFGVSKFYVEALNAGKGALTNYTYFDDSLLAKFNLYENGAYTSRFSSIKTYSGTWKESSGKSLADSRSVGIYTGSSSDGLFVAKGNGAHYPDGPFNLFEQGKDTLISITGSSSSMDPVTVIESDSVLAPQPDIRFGRIDLDDVGGNQGSVLHVPLRVEYWNGSRFIANPNDNQTDVKGVTAAERHIWPTGADADPKAVTLGAGGEVSSGSSRSVTATQAEPYRQQTRVWLDLDDSANDLPWLKYNWDNKNAGEENPSSVVTFGIHRGNDRVIYRGEPGLTGQ
ncbi:hypothetical protein OMR72_003693 [Vibrio parahaemolyticus]|uniref:DUF6701 domain-containing protein n=1 Tax=Vibrio parahaemolyticus TaxID=670 RepID=UPI0015DEBD51|nr:DUF6701 domain-containing protein [Vibrio parahaemolyticus]EJG1013634.1 hypothetical protein [Vibrio parahaemolyticus]EJG1842349.1 hypothetical protein [Vibrio parahaemolyticus]EKA8935423.1 hypothetical protein [Vibrio parahaemolyticus]EKF6611067.1 hypothetical protein [Vibrio parahaemolyticus]MBE4164053.1 hypothetical protein [Vibrio parahaemolyticus]